MLRGWVTGRWHGGDGGAKATYQYVRVVVDGTALFVSARCAVGILPSQNPGTLTPSIGPTRPAAPGCWPLLQGDDGAHAVAAAASLVAPSRAPGPPVTLETVTALLDGAVPLHCAALRGNPAQVDHLLYCGADATIRTAAGELPVEMVPVCGDRDRSAAGGGQRTCR